MENLVEQLLKRRTIMMGVVVVIGFVSILFSYYVTVVPSNYFGGQYNIQFVTFLIVYKFIELPILYYLLLHRHILYLRKHGKVEERYKKIHKHAKLLLFLIPQGNTIFGIIAYKLTGNVLLFLFFSSIALITLLLVKPHKLLL